MDAKHWDLKYAAMPGMWGATANATVVTELTDRTPGVAVDIACGDGRNAVWLAERGWDVAAVDFSPVAIGQARARSGADAVAWEVGDALVWSPGRPVDLVLITYLHVPGLAAILSRAMGWLAPGGEVLYLGHALENLEHGTGGPSDPDVLPDVGQLATALSGARIRRFEHVDRPTDNGTAVDLLVAVSGWV
ncbi:MAG: class I SAM-dependent methyltransferase [Nocardioidaceae bacterium]